LTIFYICPWAEKPTGGIKQIFRHVEALNESGFDASVLALESSMPSWFNSSACVATRVRSPLAFVRSGFSRRKNKTDWLGSSVAPQIEIRGAAGSMFRRSIGSGDIIVLPEYVGRRLRPCGFGAKLVVFNQNAHYTFNGFSYSDDFQDFLYRGQLLAALAVSKHTLEYLHFAFPDLRVLLTPNGVDGSIFAPTGGAKKKQIAFMPRKLPNTIVQVIQLLRGRGSLKGWDLCPIDGMDEADVARLLGESAIFLSTSSDEGFGLPPLEAGASGCVVIGYTGYAAREFMLPEYCYPVPQGDILGFAQTLEKVMLQFDVAPEGLLQKARAYSEFLEQNYSKKEEARQVVAAWSEICAHGEQRRADQKPTPSAALQ
jgi:hypothetical protein